MNTAYTELTRKVMGSKSTGEIEAAVCTFFVERGATLIHVGEIHDFNLGVAAPFINHDPLEYAVHYTENELFRVDPALQYLQERRPIFTWRQLERDFPENVVSAEARKFRLYEGIVVSNPTVNYSLAFMSIAGRYLSVDSHDFRDLQAFFAILIHLLVVKDAIKFDSAMAEARHVLILLAAGLSQPGIAENMGCSASKVEKLLCNLKKAYGVNNSPQLIYYATKAGLI